MATAVVLVFTVMATMAQQPERAKVRKGNDYYEQQNYVMADSLYTSAIEDAPNMAESYFNRGVARYRMDSLQRAIDDYKIAANLAADNKLKSKAHHNIGNALFEQEKYAESIEAYKDALRANPNDMDTKYNLSLAKKKLMQQQQQQKDQSKEDGKDKQKGNQGGEGDNKPEDQKGQDNKNKEGDEKNSSKDNKEEKDTDMENPDMQPGDKDKKEEKEQQPQAMPGQLSKEEAEKLLEA